MITHSSILAWKIPWTEEPGGLKFMGSQRFGHDYSDWAHTQYEWSSFYTFYYLFLIIGIKGIHIPIMNLVCLKQVKLLGKKTNSRQASQWKFGFRFIDTNSENIFGSDMWKINTSTHTNTHTTYKFKQSWHTFSIKWKFLS